MSQATNTQVAGRRGLRGGHYKWVALSNTTVGMLAATVNASIVIIALPAIFRGIKLNPLQASNISYLLWMLMGYLVVSAVLVVTLGRLGDIYGRVKMYNAGFAIFGLAAVALPFDPFIGPAGALWLIGFRIIQATGGAMIMANSPAILTDAFPSDQRGMAMGFNQIAGISGQFIGLILGGVLAAVDWRLVFIVSVPIGLGGTIWSYLSLKEIGVRTPARIDWLGNVTFAVGLIFLLTGITYGIQPYGGHAMGWTSPLVLAGLFGGVALLILFCVIETKVESPMFDLRLMKIRAFAAGTGATLLASIARGGLQFMLIIWLQGIWLPLHGYPYRETPLWSGIYLLALTFGFVASGPLSGWLSDKHGARAFASGGLVVSALAFGGLQLIPVNFSYPEFAALIFVAGAGMGLFSAPNAAAIMNSVPARQRGAASGMLATFQNAGFVLSIGVFFSLMIAGLAASLPSALTGGLTAQGVPHAIAHRIGELPPVGSLFAAFLGYNPIRQLLTPTGVLAHLPAAHVALLTGKTFFPQLISEPFHHGLVIVFSMAMALLLVAAGASALRGGRFVYEEGNGDAVAPPASSHAAPVGQPDAAGTMRAGQPTATAGPVAGNGDGRASAVVCSGLTYRFGTHTAVDDVDLRIERGETFGLLGPNGAGKTTTIRMLTTLLRPMAGSISVLGVNVADRPMLVRRMIGYVPQLLSADATLTGRENVELFARLFDVPRPLRRERVESALTAMGLTEAASRVVKTYSGGMIRRLELAQALVNSPSLLVLDEPTVGLDPIARTDVWNYIAALREQADMTVLMTTHYMDEADTYCNRVALMHAGSIRATGTPGLLKATLGAGATLDDVFRHYTGGTLDDNTESGGIRDVRRARRTARRLG